MCELLKNISQIEEQCGKNCLAAIFSSIQTKTKGKFFSKYKNQRIIILLEDEIRWYKRNRFTNFELENLIRWIDIENISEESTVRDYRIKIKSDARTIAFYNIKEGNPSHFVHQLRSISGLTVSYKHTPSWLYTYRRNLIYNYTDFEAERLVAEIEGESAFLAATDQALYIAFVPFPGLDNVKRHDFFDIQRVVIEEGLLQLKLLCIPKSLARRNELDFEDLSKIQNEAPLYFSRSVRHKLLTFVEQVNQAINT